MSTAAVSSAAEPLAGGRLPALDTLRAVGAIAVVGHHVGFHTGATGNEHWGGWLARLDVGVAIFFVLSGFLLFRPWALSAATGRPRPATGRYFWRRALRILPAYWLTVVVCLIVLPQNRPGSGADWLRHLTLTQIYSPGLLRNGLSQTWSLATEVAFYLVLPLVAVPAVGRTWRPVRTVAVAAGGLLVTAGWLAAMAAGWLDMGLHTTWLPAYGGWFGVGMALGAAHVALRTGTAPAAFRVLDDLAAAPLACWAAAVGLLAIATTPVAGPRDLAEPTPAAFAVKLTLYLAVAVLILVPVAFGPPTRIRSALMAAPARWLGAVSYGLFLWHPLVLELIYLVDDRPLFTGGLLSTFVLTMAGGLLYAAVSYYGIERPIQLLATQRRSRRPVPPVADRPMPVVSTSQ
ncbi:Peptidoglycan/LPS O-acetylase OafA/YrhL, contains acyltransferase and SGNH-hydrolase domains [Micromonospora rhizosphaerae]|uniref:Peptidoglycan/LPS O-acetylase OafA/YrhL, contains acyltransferase and SGNH-hydrolase domains n=1 Tax=Micromonospora rhizosphaerae TaxID=568872 RepID=A0A1C6RDI6_9ACTN|nr:acyltransferase [Micromonospora rhizosphaerae]SCL15157.1 Peptidoglycan/LPS O-acetylase OafA/YrhL, contains acyltransferase and SGNH-hydrolase domains [Micromonospora rhizosphaerae]